MFLIIFCEYGVLFTTPVPRNKNKRTNSLGSLIHSSQQYLEQPNEITLKIRYNLYFRNNKV